MRGGGEEGLLSKRDSDSRVRGNDGWGTGMTGVVRHGVWLGMATTGWIPAFAGMRG